MKRTLLCIILLGAVSAVTQAQELRIGTNAIELQRIPADTRKPPQVVLVLREWDPANVILACIACPQPAPKWTWRAEIFASTNDLLRRLNSCGAIPCYEGFVVGAWTIGDGKPIKLHLREELKSEAVRYEAREWIERSWELRDGVEAQP